MKHLLHPWQHSRCCLQVLVHSLSVLFQFHLLKLPLKFWSVYNMTVSWFGFIEPQYPLQLCLIGSVIHLLLVLEAAQIFLPLDNHWRIWGLCCRNDACSCQRHGNLHLDRPMALKKKVKSRYYWAVLRSTGAMLPAAASSSLYPNPPMDACEWVFNTHFLKGKFPNSLRNQKLNLVLWTHVSWKTESFMPAAWNQKQPISSSY